LTQQSLLCAKAAQSLLYAVLGYRLLLLKPARFETLHQLLPRIRTVSSHAGENRRAHPGSGRRLPVGHLSLQVAPHSLDHRLHLALLVGRHSDAVVVANPSPEQMPEEVHHLPLHVDELGSAPDAEDTPHP
jgi:hypothetical protein